MFFFLFITFKFTCGLHCWQQICVNCRKEILNDEHAACVTCDRIFHDFCVFGDNTGGATCGQCQGFLEPELPHATAHPSSAPLHARDKHASKPSDGSYKVDANGLLVRIRRVVVNILLNSHCFYKTKFSTIAHAATHSTQTT